MVDNDNPDNNETEMQADLFGASLFRPIGRIPRRYERGCIKFLPKRGRRGRFHGNQRALAFIVPFFPR